MSKTTHRVISIFHTDQSPTPQHRGLDLIPPKKDGSEV